MNRQTFLSILIALHLVVIFLYNTHSTLTGYQAVYPSVQKHAWYDGLLSRVLDPLLQWAPLAWHARLSGIETGYGFFAPQVGSQYVTRFSMLDALGDTIQMVEMPPLQRSESQLRYAGFLDAMQAFIGDTATADPDELRYARALIHAMAERLARHYGGASVSCEVLVYRHPPLRGSRQRRPILMPVYAKTLSIPVL